MLGKGFFKYYNAIQSVVSCKKKIYDINPTLLDILLSKWYKTKVENITINGKYVKNVLKDIKGKITPFLG